MLLVKTGEGVKSSEVEIKLWSVGLLDVGADDGTDVTKS